MATVEDLSFEELCLFTIISDPSGLDLAEFSWFAAEEDETDGCWRARPYQWPWFRCTDTLQIDQCARSVGKSLSIKLRGFAFPFLWPGQEMVITAPEKNHLQPITDLIEEQFYSTRLGREMLVKSAKGRSAVTHTPFVMKFANQARIMGRIPQRDGKGVKGIHPLWLELDEAQDYPAPGWTEIIETLKRRPGAVWRAHGVTRGVQDEFYKRSASPGTNWKVHRFSAMHTPEWSAEVRADKEAEYGSREDPDYKRNVLGEHGDATNPIFVLRRLMKCVDDEEGSDYNENEYIVTKFTDEMLNDFPGDIEDYLERDIPIMPDKYKKFWMGMDVGYTIDPSEILVFAEYVPDATEKRIRRKNFKKVPEDGQTNLKLVCRVQMKRLSAPLQARAIKWLIRHFGGPGQKKLMGFSMDSTGNGWPLFEILQDPEVNKGEDRIDLNKIKGYKFGSKILVDFDDRVTLEARDDPEKEAGVHAYVEVYATDLLRRLVDQGRLWLPFDDTLLESFQGQTQQAIAMDAYGKRRFSTGNFHVLDAARMAVLGWKQEPIEKMTKGRVQEDVLDYALDFGYGGDDDDGWVAVY